MEPETGSSDWQKEPFTGLFGILFSGEGNSGDRSRETISYTDLLWEVNPDMHILRRRVPGRVLPEKARMAFFKKGTTPLFCENAISAPDRLELACIGLEKRFSPRGFFWRIAPGSLLQGRK
jgi:hypothetical protein